MPSFLSKVSGDWIEFYPDCDATFDNTPRVAVNLSQTQKKCLVKSPNLPFRTGLWVMKVAEKKQTRITM